MIFGTYWVIIKCIYLFLIILEAIDKQNNNDTNILRPYVFDIEECLNCFDDVMRDFPKMKVKKFPENLNIENTKLFYMLLEKFNKIYHSSLSTQNILTSRSSFNAFFDFVFYCALNSKIEIEKSQLKNFMIALNKLRQKYNQNLRSLDKYYDEILRKIYYPKWLDKSNEMVKKEMYRFEQAYSLMKLAFENEKRDNGERYFEHLKWVMEILLRELKKPNLDKIIIALLHDVKEDLPQYAQIIKTIYWDYIADGVDALSKKDWKLYLDKNELEKLENCKDPECVKQLEQIWKERRNQDYFGHLDTLNDDYLDVKLADRIHNLRDMTGVDRDKAIRKIKETQKYFLDVAKKRNPIAYELLLREIWSLKEYFDLNWENKKTR